MIVTITVQTAVSWVLLIVSFCIGAMQALFRMCYKVSSRRTFGLVLYLARGFRSDFCGFMVLKQLIILCGIAASYTWLDLLVHQWQSQCKGTIIFGNFIRSLKEYLLVPLIEKLQRGNKVHFVTVVLSLDVALSKTGTFVFSVWVYSDLLVIYLCCNINTIGPYTHRHSSIELHDVNTISNRLFEHS